ncbi:MAG: methylated-DNA--[protein]-cysteine S-methyltransferase [Bacteroidota bacterium]
MLRDDVAYWTPFDTPLGTAYIASTLRGVCRLTVPDATREHFFVGLYRQFDPDQVRPHPGPNMEAIEQLEEYWRGERSRFDLRLDTAGTDFQRQTWDALLHIPYGRTITYAELANDLGMPKGYQAVGAAIGQNPVLLLTPCHRVLGSNGELTGFAAGAQSKRWLLRHEGALLL